MSPAGSPAQYAWYSPAVSAPNAPAEAKRVSPTATAAPNRRRRAPMVPPRSLLQPGDAHRRAVALRAIERVAVFAVHRRVVGAGEQQPVAVPTLVLAVILEQDLADLLVVRVVAHAAGEQCKALHQRLPVGARIEIGLGPGGAVGPVQRDDRGVDAVEDLLGRQLVGGD